jgi:hypothetical protein
LVWIAGPILGFVIVSLLGLADERFGVRSPGFRISRSCRCL